MRATETAVPEPVKLVLMAADVEVDRVKLAGQLSPQLYKQTADVLDRIGGKWNRGQKCHTFEVDDDVRGLVKEMIETGQMPQKNPNAFFETTGGVIRRMEYLARPTVGSWADMTCLEPSAGEGAIAKVLVGLGVKQLVAIEIDPARVEKCRAVLPRNLTVMCQDFLEEQPVVWTPPTIMGYYDRILMNPPFALTLDRQAYIAHIQHAYKFLKVGGRLVSVAPSSVKFRTDKRTVSLRSMIESQGFMEDLPEDAFRASGTDVRTVLVVLNKD